MKKYFFIIGIITFVSGSLAAITAKYSNGYIFAVPGCLIEKDAWQSVDSITQVKYYIQPDHKDTISPSDTDLSQHRGEKFLTGRAIDFCDKNRQGTAIVDQEASHIPVGLAQAILKSGRPGRSDWEGCSTPDYRQKENLGCWDADGYVVKGTTKEGRRVILVSLAYNLGYHVFYHDYLFSYHKASNTVGNLKRTIWFHHDYDIHLGWLALFFGYFSLLFFVVFTAIWLPHALKIMLKRKKIFLALPFQAAFIYIIYFGFKTMLIEDLDTDSLLVFIPASFMLTALCSELIFLWIMGWQREILFIRCVIIALILAIVNEWQAKFFLGYGPMFITFLFVFSGVFFGSLGADYGLKVYRKRSV